MAIPDDVTPESPIEEQPVIGLIGMGAMGTMYATHFVNAGWKKIYVCDLPDKYDGLKEKYKDVPAITVLRDGHLVSRASDFIMYLVEAEFIDNVVRQCGPSTKLGAIVSGQTSVKAVERAAFDKWLPSDVSVISCHSMHGPTVSPVGQPLVLIRHRASDRDLRLVENILRHLKSRYVYLSYEEHDEVSANTQAVTHAAFLSMGTAWARMKQYPWEHGKYVGGIETVKVNIMLRIYSNQWHVYAGLAILNPTARVQIDQYARSTLEIFKLMLHLDEEGLRKRIYAARDKVFGAAQTCRPMLLSEDILDQFNLGRASPPNNPSSPVNGAPASPVGPTPSQPHAVNGKLNGNGAARRDINSHLSLLAMVDCWAQLDIQPFVHLDLAATPLFRMWIGVAEILFRSQPRLDGAIHSAIYNNSHRSDDLEFVIAAGEWSRCISHGNFGLYQQRFSETASFFESRFEEATKVGSAMIKTIMEMSH